MIANGKYTLSKPEERFARELLALLRTHGDDLAALELGNGTAPIVVGLSQAEISDCGIIITREFDILRDIELRLVDHLRIDICIPVLSCSGGETWGEPIYFKPEGMRERFEVTS